MPEEVKKKVSRRKKAPAKVAAAPEAAPAPAPAPKPLRVKMNDLWNMRLAQQEKFAAEADQRTALQKAETQRALRLYFLAKLDPKGHILACEKKAENAKAEAETAAKRAEKAENKVLLMQKRMEDTIGRPVKNLGIDLDTGEVILPPQE
jgi:hypothetical protein